MAVTFGGEPSDYGCGVDIVKQDGKWFISDGSDSTGTGDYKPANDARRPTPAGAADRARPARRRPSSKPVVAVAADTADTAQSPAKPVRHRRRARTPTASRPSPGAGAVFFAVRQHVNLGVDLMFFDTTSTYFKRGTEEAPDQDHPEGKLRRYGHSKDSRSDLLQIMIGLAVAREGIPVRCWV